MVFFSCWNEQEPEVSGRDISIRVAGLAGNCPHRSSRALEIIVKSDGAF